MGRIQGIEAILEDQLETARRFFEPRLTELGLSVSQINALDVVGLRNALERVNDAIKHPEQFGVLNLKVTANVGVVVTKATQDAHMAVGILPILLERKQLILDRLRDLSSSERVSNLQELVGSIPDISLRSNLETQLASLEAESQRLRAEKAEVQAAQEEASLTTVSLIEQKRFELERLERRSAVWRAFLERESVATVLGAILLLALVITLIVAMFTKTTVPDLVSNAFLIILGYFFGQASARRSEA